MSSVKLEERLSDAAFRGDVAALTDLLVQNPNLVDKHYLKCEDKNVLHVTATLGEVKIFQAVLQANSSLCHDLCLARDRDGKNPIHLAASHGKLEILKSIKDHDWLVQADLEKADSGGTILHLCVKHNQLDALRLLLDIFTDPDFQTARNEDGMTILHLAMYYNKNQGRREEIMYLINNVAKIVNLKNADGKTALDLFLIEAGIGLRPYIGRRKRMNQYDKEMAHSLRQAKALQGRDIYIEWFRKSRDALMVVASLIATMAFQAMISPPGGVWQDDLLEGDNPHRVGQSVMAQTHPNYYNLLITANTVAFVSSLSMIILLARGIGIRSPHFFTFSSVIMWLSMAAIAVVYGMSLNFIMPEPVGRSKASNSDRTVIICFMVSILAPLAMMVLGWKDHDKSSISNDV